MIETPRAGSEHSEALSALYRAAGDEAPPPALDAAIRAAARRAVAAGPRRAGAPFGGWRVPLSLAALIVLSVSLVTLMQEEAPELVMSPHAGAPGSTLQADRPQAPAAPAPADADTAANAQASDDRKSSAIGLRPREPSGPPSVGLRGVTPTPGADAAADVRKQAAQKPPAEDNLAPPAQREPAADAFPGSAALRDRAGSEAAPGAERKAAEPARALSRFAENPQLANTAEPSQPGPAAQAPAVAGAGASGSLQAEERRADRTAREQPRGRMESAPVQALPAQPPSSADQAFMHLSPAKWLELIEALVKQGRYDEAKASLAQFRRRHRDYPLPDSLKAWAYP